MKIETVERLNEPGADLTLVTSGNSAFHRRKIERFRLYRLFDCILIEGEQGYGKPDCRIIPDVLAKRDASTEYACMTGDNQNWNIIPPQKLGMGAIWVNGKSAPTLPDKVPILALGAFSEFMQYI